jgi:hypothetical protein
MYEILFYEDQEGNKPVEDFIDKLDELALSGIEEAAAATFG